MSSLPAFKTNTKLDSTFETDILNTHLVYDYDAEDSEGNPEKWRYEIYFASSERVIYAIHGGPMAGRVNYQSATYQCIRPGQLWQINWLEETGSVVSAVYDIERQEMTTLIAFSKGHWENPKDAHGDKRNEKDFERWRGLAKIGSQVERYMLSERAKIVERFKGRGELKDIPDGAKMT